MWLFCIMLFSCCIVGRPFVSLTLFYRDILQLFGELWLNFAVGGSTFVAVLYIYIPTNTQIETYTYLYIT